jgi:hypothetical protein
MPYVFLAPNASLATPERVREVMAVGLDSLKWSMNAADEAQFEEVKFVAPKNFERALENVAAAWRVRSEGGYKTRLYASSIRYAGEQQPLMQALLEERVVPYVDEHFRLPLCSMGGVSQREAEAGFRPTAGNQGHQGATREPLPCWSAFIEEHVTAEGKLTACCFDANANWTMGDLHQQSSAGAWNNDRFLVLRAARL